MTISKSQLKPERLLLSTRLILKGHVLNPLWYSAEHRRAIRSAVFSKYVGGYVSRHYLAAAEKAVPSVPDGEEEKIWAIWFQGEKNAPELIKTCYESIRKYHPGKLVVVDMDTLFDYITLPDEIVRKFREGKINYAHFSDICRVELLYEHGGIWLDSTCFLTGPVPDFIQERDFFVYRSGHKISGYYSYIQNCFIRARKGSELLAGWRAMIIDFWMKEDKRADYFQHQLMFKALVEGNSCAAELFSTMPQMDHDPLHSIWCLRGNEPYDKASYDAMIDPDYFFQKTTYRDVPTIIPGSYRDFILKHGND